MKYGTLDRLIKLLRDSGVDNVNVKPKSQQIYLYEDTLSVNEGITNLVAINNIIYATATGDKGDSYYVIVQPTPPKIIKPPVSLPDQPNSDQMATIAQSTDFTSGANGTTVVTLTDKDGNSMAGTDVIQVELEIKPLKNTEWVWNKTLSQLTLVGGNVLDAGQTLFVLFNRTVNI